MEGIIIDNESTVVFKKLSKKKLERLDIRKLEQHIKALYTVLNEIYTKNIVESNVFKVIMKFRKECLVYVIHQYTRNT